jgi:hypothetical protein
MQVSGGWLSEENKVKKVYELDSKAKRIKKRKKGEAIK